MKWEKMFASHISHKGLTFKINKELIKLKTKQNKILLKMGRGT